ncbi:hypothetical protein M9978_02500 [Sphingomonas sp. MG17]|uniref:Uncharacterized protein n=1 Tax=Sphingomonas tagetis TaxID=2949092 RepID=A0A9X2HG72_9SPHN|nr:hypothetical protein [Sphingomonas tagetis]MCP3729287.1 hypothetical protein [Sphingomonas tagetis]
MAHDQPRRPLELHPADCPCCSDDPAALDLGAVALRLIVGFGLGGLVIFFLDVAGIGAGAAVIIGGLPQ